MSTCLLTLLRGAPFDGIERMQRNFELMRRQQWLAFSVSEPE
jgi:hypothetical protein